MLPNMRLSGSTNSTIDSMNDFLGVSMADRASIAAIMANNNKNNNINLINNANRIAVGLPSAASSAATSSSSSSSSLQSTITNQSNWGTTKTLADYVKESSWPSSNSQSASGSSNNTTTSMPWAAAVSKSPPDQHVQNNSFDYNNTIGSWNSPETSSSNRGGWNDKGSSKNGDGLFDDGTAIWGNPTTKKSGVDWAEKESSLNPPHAQANNNSEKKVQKAEPIVSSINGTEAWGTPTAKSSSISQQQQQQRRQPFKNDNSGNTYGTKSIDDSLRSWGESSSLQSAISNENSSLPNNNSVWNNHLVINNKQKSSDWLSSTGGLVGSGGSGISINSAATSRLDELNKQLESTGLFNSVLSSMTKNVPANNNPNLDHQSIGIGLGAVNASNVLNNGANFIGEGNGINDLKQMSANYTNDLLDSPDRQTSGGQSSINNNQQSQQLLDSSAYSSTVTPSRDLLKQMVHQIQLAVQAGHLNAHILNQPMSTPTLQLVYQLLQQIKNLHQLQELQQRKPELGASNNLDSQINGIRQNISSLQKAITQQQAALTKNENPGVASDSSTSAKQLANHSYATISKLSTNMKVPPQNFVSNIMTNSNIDSFRRSSLIDTIGNSNSDSLRSTQATFNADPTIDKTFSMLVQTSSAENILRGNNKPVTASGQLDGVRGQQGTNKGLLSAHSSSSPSTAWSAFGSGDFMSDHQQSWPNQLRISSNVSQDQQQQQQQHHHHNQYSAFDIMPDFSSGKSWRDSPILTDDKQNSTNLAPGRNLVNISSQNSATNNSKHMSEMGDILNRNSSLFCDWSNNTDSNKRNFEQQSSNISAGSFSSSGNVGGLSLQSNSWMFGPNSSAIDIGGGIENMTKNNGTMNISNKLDNGNTDKMSDESLNFLRSSKEIGNIQRSSSALYDWSKLASTTLQLETDNNELANQRAGNSAMRPGPPPGLLNNFGPVIGGSSSSNGISMLDGKAPSSNDEAQLQSRESSSSLWSGAWFD